MALAPTFLVSPVVADRRWDDALVPRTGGGWNWICQFYNYPNPNPTEWVVMHLETGDYAVYVDSPYTPGDLGRYTAGQHFLIANQLRAPNGRVFFPAVDAWLWYYDPSDEKVHDLGVVTSTPPFDTSLYHASFNTDGSLLLGGTYGASQLANNFEFRPRFVTVNPSTLAIRDYGRVGSTGHTHNAIGYYTHCDGAGSNWAYVLVGEDIWDVVAVNLTTGATTVLATATYNPWAFFQEKPEGLTVQLYTDYRGPSQSLNQFWVVDGQMYPYTPGYNPATLPFTPRTVTPYTNPIVSPPQVDYTLLPDQLQWRANGSSGAYTQNPFALHYTSPIKLESLLAMPDGSLLCNAQQYQGFARYYPDTGYVNYFGAWANGISEGTARLLVGTKAYISGYPNGLLFDYDTMQPWTQTSQSATANPKYCGAFSPSGLTLSGIKHAEFLAYSAGTHRVFMVGLRDRDGSGLGVGYFDTVARTFGGTYAGNDLYTGDCGIAVFDSLDRVAVSGQISSGDAQIILYDRNLTEIERQTPITGLTSTGRLFTTGESGVVVGISRSGVAYRWNITTKQLLGQVSLAAYNPVAGKEPSNAYQRADGSILTGMGGVLYSIDPLTLVVTSEGTLAYDSQSSFAELGGTLYAALSTNIYALTPVVGPPPDDTFGLQVARPTIPQTNGFYPRASLDNPDTVEAVISNLNEHAAALDTVQTAVAVTGVVWSSYPGVPESHVIGNPGDMCADTLNGELYIKHSGSATNTGWKLVTRAA